MDERLYRPCKVHLNRCDYSTYIVCSVALRRLPFMHDKKLFLPCKVALENKIVPFKTKIVPFETKIVPFKNIANVMNVGPDKSKVKTRSGRTATVFNCDKRTKQNVIVKDNVRNSKEQNVTESKRTNNVNKHTNTIRTRRSNDKNLNDKQNKGLKIDTKTKTETNKTHESQSSEKRKQQNKNRVPKEVNIKIKTQNNINKQNSVISDKKTNKRQTRSNNKLNESQKLETKTLSKPNKSINKDSGIQNDSIEKTDTAIITASITKNENQPKDVQNILEAKRVRKILNYRESIGECNGSKHIPIYRKLKMQHNEICHTKDVYEFHEVRENKKTHDSLLDNPFNKEMDEILIALEKKEKKAQKPIKRAVRAKRNKLKLISKTENKVINAAKQENIPRSQLENVTNNNIENKQKPLKSSTQQIDNDNTADDWVELFDNSLTEQPQIETNKNVNNIKILANVCITRPQPDTPKRVQFSKQPQNPEPYTSVEWIDDSTNELQVSFKRPNANSTMIFNTISSPWRSNLIMKGSPHFLLTKKSNLPIYEQDMVINSSIVEKTLHNDSITPIRKTKQSSMLNFITSNRVYDDSNKESDQNRSLYDEHLLSPIKKQPSANKVSKNKLGETNFAETNARNAKRKVFGKRNSQDSIERAQSSPKKILGDMQVNTRSIKRRVFGERNSQDDLQDSIGRSQVFECYSVEDKENFNPTEDTCFGFDASTKKSKSPKKKDPKNSSSKPTRIHVNEIKEVLFGDEIPDASVEIGEDFGNVEENQNLQQQQEETSFVGLFEDLKEYKAPPRVTYERKRTKRRRYHSMQEDDEEIIPKVKKKKKDEPTKKELKEAAEWAAAFNAMCEEVEAHTLEIE